MSVLKTVLLKTVSAEKIVKKKKEKEKLIYILGVEEFFHFMHCADECVSSLYLLSFDMC